MSCNITIGDLIEFKPGYWCYDVNTDNLGVEKIRHPEAPIGVPWQISDYVKTNRFISTYTWTHRAFNDLGYAEFLFIDRVFSYENGHKPIHLTKEIVTKLEESLPGLVGLPFSQTQFASWLAFWSRHALMNAKTPVIYFH